MQAFELVRRRKAAWGTFWPAAVTKERETAGRSAVGVEAEGLCYRMVVGNIEAMRLRAEMIAMEYSPNRFRHPTIDQVRLFEEGPTATNTGFVVHDYAGAIDTISRETVAVMGRDGRRMALPRDQAVGFRHIICASESSWDAGQFMMDELAKVRVRELVRGHDMAEMSVREPWRLKAAAEQQLLDLTALAWTEYTTEPTPERLAQVLEFEKLIQNYMLSELSYLQASGTWETLRRPSFPDAATALALWERDRIDDLHYEETAPWWGNGDKPSPEVTVFRRAYISTNRFAITLTTNPRVHCLVAEDRPVMHQMIRYHPVEGIRSVQLHAKWVETGDPKQVFQDPQGGNKYWRGQLNTQEPWEVVTGSEVIPEPKMRLRERLVPVQSADVELVAAAMKEDRPTLIPIVMNGYDGLALVFPRMYVNVLIDPLFGGGARISPLQEGNSATGWAVRRGPGVLGQLVDRPESGFLETPISGRPMREGVIQEIIPSA